MTGVHCHFDPNADRPSFGASRACVGDHNQSPPREAFASDAFASIRFTIGSSSAGAGVRLTFTCFVRNRSVSFFIAVSK